MLLIYCCFDLTCCFASDYARELQETLFRSTGKKPKDLRSSIDEVRNSQPAPLSSKATRIDKTEAIANHHHRFRLDKEAAVSDSDSSMSVDDH